VAAVDSTVVAAATAVEDTADTANPNRSTQRQSQGPFPQEWASD
jgi:hypothetical protein